MKLCTPINDITTFLRNFEQYTYFIKLHPHLTNEQ